MSVRRSISRISIRTVLASVAPSVLGCAEVATIDPWNGPSGAPDAGSTGGSGPEYAAVILEDNPRAYWRFDEESGAAQARDATANGHDGTYVAGVDVGVDGIVDGNTAVELDGGGGHVDFGDVLDFSGTQPFTFEVWVNFITLDDNYRRLFGKTIEDSRTGHFVFVRQASDGDSGVIYQRYDANKYLCGAASKPAPSLGTFVHVAVTFDGSHAVLYVDGTPNLGCDGDFPIGATPGMSFTIGSGGSGLGAIIDEAAVYQSALPADSIRERLEAVGR